MAETFEITRNADRLTRYSEIAPQIEALVADESDVTANLANIAAALKDAFGFYWVGFYLKKDDQLVLGPFQGPVACTRIGFGEGVCGHSFSQKKVMVVPNVDEFPRHIACSGDSKSEIVIPLFGRDRNPIGVLDVDSRKLNDFTDVDKAGLQQIVSIIEKKVFY